MRCGYMTVDSQDAVAQGEVRGGERDDRQHQHQRRHDAQPAADDDDDEEVAHLCGIADTAGPGRYETVWM